jgi:3-oxoacyl-[acyl-carrier protein] reductase
MAAMSMLEEKVAIVTGSARGIGLATAQRLAEEGARVVISDLDGDAAATAAAALPGEHAVHVGDITRDGVPEALVQTAIDRWGRLDVIVNNAGYTLDGPVHKMSDDAFRRMLEIHTVAPFRVVRAAAPHLREPAKREREQGREVFRKIVNVTSVSGVMGSAGQANYASAKAGVIGLTKTLAKEWGQFKVNCNAVAFGFVDTRLTAGKDPANVIEVGGETIQLGIPDQLRELTQTLVPLGRTTTAREAAGAILFLCAPLSDYVQGQVLNVTGGLSVGMSS